MQSPYLSILAASAVAASTAPHLHQRDASPIDPLATPSDEATYARNVRLARAAADRALFVGHVQRRGDYPAIVGAPMPGTFRTYR